MSSGSNKIFRYLLITQGVYYLITALWGILDIDSFMAVTGPKKDVWLVKTVSVLIVPIAVCLISFLFFKSDPMSAIILGLTSTAGLAIIDFYYSIRDVISDVYMVDGAVQVLLFIWWIIVWVKERIRK
jgi:hypothetical protein